MAWDPNEDPSNPVLRRRNYAPYEESSAKAALRIALAGLAAGARVPAGANALQAFGIGAGNALQTRQASEQAAQDYAMKQMQAEQAREDRDIRNRYTEALIKQTEKPPKVETRKTPTNILEMTPEEFALYKTRQAELRPAKDTPDEAIAMSDDAMDIAADMYLNTGQLPSLGMGKGAAATRTKIVERAAKRRPGANIAQNKASTAAGTRSLTALQLLYEQSTAFEKTALANADVLMSTVKGIPETGTRFGNKVTRWLAAQTGSPEVTQFNAAMEVVKPEFARILSSAGAGGVAQLPVAARKDMAAVLNGDFTKKQLESALSILKRDAANKRKSYAEQIEGIRGGIGTRGGPQIGADNGFDPEAARAKYGY